MCVCVSTFPPFLQSGFQCPTCKKSYGVKTGDMPDGQMSVRTLPSQRLPGHEGYGAIEITYNFRPGVYVRHRMILY